MKGNRYFLPQAAGKKMRAEAVVAAPAPGEVWIFGLTKVARELITGNSPEMKKFRGEAAVTKMRKSNPADISAEDFAGAFTTILAAVESPEGKKLDPGPALVGEPNRIAIIRNKEGFALQ
jgi:hypothetical protein